MYFVKCLLSCVSAVLHGAFQRWSNGDMVSVFDYDDPRAFLRDAYDARKQEDPQFSHRYIASRLGVKSSGVFGQILTGKLKISTKLASGLADVFGLSLKEKRCFDLIVAAAQADTAVGRRRAAEGIAEFVEINSKLVQPDEYHYFSRWYYSAVRGLLYCHEFDGSDYGALGQMLDPPISAAQAQRAIEVLVRLGLVRKTEKGFYGPCTPVVSTGRNKVVSPLVDSFHLQAMQLGKRSIDHFPKDQRHISMLALSMSENGYRKLEKIIDKCRQEALAMAVNDSNPTKVYMASFQVFPVTREETQG